MGNKEVNTSEIPELHQNDSKLSSSVEDLNMSKEQPLSSDAEKSKVLGEEIPTEANETQDPVFDGTEVTGRESSRSLDLDSEAQVSPWPEKAVALTNLVKEKGVVAVSTVLRRLSGKKDDKEQYDNEDSKANELAQKIGEWAIWNPLSFIKIGRQESEGSNDEKPADLPAMKGRITLYTKLGCSECKQVRIFMHQRRLQYIEINIDIYPGRKLEVEKKTGSFAVPKVFFNELLIGGFDDLKALDESGELGMKINLLMNNEPSPATPLPPLPGEDDVSGSGTVDELASIVMKMKAAVIPKDRFHKMRMFTNCFLGSEAVDFLSEDQYLEREEAVEFGRKLVAKHFFRHVLDENTFEDGNHLYRFLDDDPILVSQCYNIPRGIMDIKPKPLSEIALRLRLLSLAIFEAYASDDGKHIDYRGIYHSEEYKRYLRIVEELQRVELREVSREEKLAFFINLYNMMVIHAILTLGHPIGALDRRKFLGDFKYVVGGLLYSLSGIQNGILRGNQRPPYNITKPFGPRDGRSKVSLPYAEPLVHFALVFGTRSGPAIRCYSPGDIDKELMEAARDFLRNGGLVLDSENNLVSANKILKWFSVDFGKNETEVIKHASNYLEASKSEELLKMIAGGQLKVVYQPFDWGLNY